MTTIATIFELRIGMNDAIFPSRDQLDAFLDSRKDSHGKERHRDDFAKYAQILERLAEFKGLQRKDAVRLNFHAHLFYAMLDHSHFFNRELMAAVEQYKYHLQELRTIDLKKPIAFIRAAEEDMKALRSDRKADAVKLAKLQDLVEGRKEVLASLKRQWHTLVRENIHIALYIRDSLIKISRLCQTALALLAEKQGMRSVQLQLVADITEHFREQLKISHREGPVSKQHLEAMRQDADTIIKETTTLLLDSVSVLAKLYRTLEEHTRAFASKINDLVGNLNEDKSRNIELDRLLFTQIEQVLVPLLSQYHFELTKTEMLTKTGHKNFFLATRLNVLDYVFNMLNQDRRSRSDRRSGMERRKQKVSGNERAEARSGKDRRIAKKRRKPAI